MANAQDPPNDRAPGASAKDATPDPARTEPPRASGEFMAFGVPRVSAMRPAPVPVLSRPPSPAHDAILARVARALDALGPAPEEARVADEFVAVLTDLLPDRLLAIRVVDESESPPWEAHASQPFTGPRTCIISGAVDGIDVEARADGTLMALVSVERTTAEGDAAYDAAIASAVAPFLAHALRSARAARAARSEAQMLEARLARADKLATIGQFAATLAHEINNPLASILLSAQYLAQIVQSDPVVAARVEHIVDAATRIQSFTRRMLAYARSAPEHPSPTSIAEVLEQAMLFCEHVAIETGATLEGDVEPELPRVRGIRSDLTQVFVNLITNACHATERGCGRVVIRARRAGEALVRVAVEDNGHGIAPEHARRIFEPFFTTKPADAGTGLGLSIVRNILHAHGATLRVSSMAGQGTIFEVDLPCESPG